ncbi:hypothetical protein K8B33_02130 [Alcanivorax sp. JB21]|uniref:hypothetical protein n=1 Tax=Alcanivorax limicola TaxID=2874102 RepID=UPI001CC06FCD|nr:hypothetical protein [Alcanivorax limicola]MBZ2187882.1 hypothetical protein [Alcanivorax limicola]
MLRVLLVLAGLLAIAVVLWASWRIDRRLFAGTLVAVLIGALMFALGFWHSRGQAQVVLPADAVSLSLSQSRGMEIGIRIRGRVTNHSEHALARVKARVTLLQCADLDGTDADSTDADSTDATHCEAVGKDTIDLRQHVPAGADYPYSTMVNLSADLLDGTTQWQVEPLSVIGYAITERTRH